MGIVDYTELYVLQDSIAGLVCSTEGDYYLTGGTCLHRYYHPERYSDDLDFFHSDPDLFRAWTRSVRSKLQESGYTFSLMIDSRDFIRMSINDTLKLDLVAERVFRLGTTIVHPSGVKLDNLSNLLANKLTAIIGRDEPKDVFDFYTIVAHERFEWTQILAGAEKKCAFSKDELVARLESFPEKLLDKLNVLPTCELPVVKSGLKRATSALIRGGENQPWILR